MKAYDSKKMKEILSSGTPKQKAALLCAHDYSIRESGKPLLSDEEKKTIFNSLKTEAEQKEFRKWMDAKFRIMDFMPYLILQSIEVQAAANDLMAYIKEWEAYTREVDHLNALCMFIEEEAPKMQAAFKEEVQGLIFHHATVERAQDGLFTLNVDGEGKLYEIIQYKADAYKGKMSTLKGMITAFEDFIKRKSMKAFVPRLYDQEVSKAKMDLGEEIAPYYSKHRLNDLRKRGYSITPADEKKAVFPDYDEIEREEEYYNVTMENLNL